MAAALPVNIRFGAFDKISMPLRKIRANIFVFGKAVDNVNRKLSTFSKRTGLTSFGKRIGKLGAGFSRIGGEVGSLARKFAIFGPIVAGVFGKLIHDSAESADQLRKLSARSGVGIERLQTLGFAASQSGVSTEEFQMSIDGLNGKLGLLKRGSGPLMKSLGKLSPSLVTALKGAKNSEEAFDVLRLAMSRTTDNTVKAQIAQAAFGKKGTKFINFLSMSSEELAKLEAEGRANGIITAEQAEAAEKMNDSISSLFSALKGLRNGALAPLFEPLTEIANALRVIAITEGPKLIAWVKEGIAAFKGNKTTLEAVKDAFKSLQETLKPIINIFTFLTDIFGTANVVIALVAGVIFGPLIAAFVALIPLIWSAAAGFFALTWPVQLVILAVAALIAIVVAVITHWQQVKDFFVSMWDGIKKLFFDGVAFISRMITSVVALLPDVIKTKIGIDTTELDRLDRERKTNVSAGLGALPGGGTSTQNSSVAVDFSNLPRGTKVQSQSEGNFELNLGFAGGIQ